MFYVIQYRPRVRIHIGELTLREALVLLMEGRHYGHRMRMGVRI